MKSGQSTPWRFSKSILTKICASIFAESTEKLTTIWQSPEEMPTGPLAPDYMQDGQNYFIDGETNPGSAMKEKNMKQGNTSSSSCNDTPQRIVKSRQFPTLLMQAEPRQVVTANERACELFNKGLIEIEGYRGGQVFDCSHSFTEAGCGKDENCEDCKIKNAVVDTFASGKSHTNIQTILDINKQNKIIPYAMLVSTEKVGEFVLITVNKFERKY